MIYVWIIALIFLFLIKAVSSPQGILKNRLHYKRVVLKSGRFTSKPQYLTFINLPFKYRALHDHVLKCITYHSPITYSKINVKLLKNSGINLTKPLYLQEYPNKKLFKKLYLFSKKYDFNLVIFEKINKLKKYIKYIKKNNNLKVLCESDISKELKENIYKLNINFNSQKLKQNTLNNGFIFENYKQNEHFDELNLVQCYYNNNFNIDIIKNKFKSTAYYLKIKNISNKTNKINFNFVENFNSSNLSYYLFKRMGRCIKAINILTNEESFIYTSIIPKNVSYSSVDGLKTSNKPCLIFEFSLLLKAGEERKIIIAKSRETLKKYLNIFQENQVELKKLFNIKIQTGDKALDNLFNHTLPRRIALSGIESFKGGDFSLEEVLKLYKENKISSYECYQLLKNKFVLENKDSLEFQPNLMNYKLKVFLENKVKTICASKGEKTCLNIDDVLYYNARTISKTALSKAKNEIKIVF